MVLCLATSISTVSLSMRQMTLGNYREKNWKCHDRTKYLRISTYNNNFATAQLRTILL